MLSFLPHPLLSSPKAHSFLTFAFSWKYQACVCFMEPVLVPLFEVSSLISALLTPALTFNWSLLCLNIRELFPNHTLFEILTLGQKLWHMLNYFGGWGRRIASQNPAREILVRLHISHHHLPPVYSSSPWYAFWSPQQITDTQEICVKGVN